MFWEAELSAIKARKRQLMTATDLQRVLAVVHARNVRQSLHWVETLSGGWSAARPLVSVVAPLAGMLIGGRRSRWTRWSSIAGSLWQGFRFASARWRQQS